LIELGTKPSIGGSASYPETGTDPPLSVGGGTPIGSGLTAHYAVLYRNATPAYCPPGTVNVTNGFAVLW
jgi:hypothetical protein